MSQFSIFYPIKPLIVSQNFGEVANLQYYLDHGIQFVGHNGIDMIAKHGQPVYATHDGIAYPEVDDRQGHGVVLITLQEFDYGSSKAYFKTIYWHLINNIPVKYGQQVKAGDIIGYANTTGLSTGDHLHFGVKPVAKTGEPNDTWYNLEQNNGFMGAINPNPFFNGKFAEDISGKYTYTIDFGYGATGQDVIQLQTFLISKNYLTIPIGTPKGYFGNLTKLGVIHWQKDNGIPPTGFIGPISRGKLNSL